MNGNRTSNFILIHEAKGLQFLKHCVFLAAFQDGSAQLLPSEGKRLDPAITWQDGNSAITAVSCTCCPCQWWPAMLGGQTVVSLLSSQQTHTHRAELLPRNALELFQLLCLWCSAHSYISTSTRVPIVSMSTGAQCS